MQPRKFIKPGEKVPLKLSAAERTLLLEVVDTLPPEYEAAVRDTPVGQPLMFTLDEVDDFGGYVAAEANHAKDKKLQRKLDAIFAKLDDLLGTYTDEEPPTILKLRRG